jgi:hypothetical protein
LELSTQSQTVRNYWLWRWKKRTYTTRVIIA